MHRDDDDTSVDGGDDSDHHANSDEEKVEQARFTNLVHSTTPQNNNNNNNNVLCCTGTSLQKGAAAHDSLAPFPTTPPTPSLDPSSHLIWSDEVDASLLANPRSGSASASTTSFSTTLLPPPPPLLSLSLKEKRASNHEEEVVAEEEEEADAHSSTIEMESLVSALVEEDEHDSLHHTLHHLLATATTTTATATSTTTVMEQTEALDLDVVEEASVAAVETLYPGQPAVLDTVDIDFEKNTVKKMGALSLPTATTGSVVAGGVAVSEPESLKKKRVGDAFFSLFK